MRRRDLLRGLAAAPLLRPPAVFAGDRPGDPPFQTRSAALGANGMAATAHPLASLAAVEVLKAGGSAVDAAIAANAMLGVVEPTGCGIGGDLFALVWDPAERRLLGLDASGFAPAGLDVDALVRRHRARGAIDPLGMDAVTVPGAVAGWAALHARFGRLPPAVLLAPAIAVAREGVPLAPVIARGWAANVRGFEAGRARIEAADLAFALFAPAGLPAEGDRFTNPDLAATYEGLARDGWTSFYRGPFAADLEAHFRAHGRPMRAADLAAMQAEWVTPISAPYRGVRLWQIPPATQGVTTLQMARIVERFPMAELAEADRLHVLVEAKKLAFADRARFLADPRKVRVPVEALLSDAYVAARAARIAMGSALPDDVPPGDPEEHSDTSYLATADSSGMMVSLIQSNYRGMGSGVVVPRRVPVPGGRGTWGFMLQNRGAQFSLDPRAANAIAPGKRPFHTIIPGFVTRPGPAHDAPLLAFGVMGGTMQPQGQVQVLVNLVDLGLDVQAAGDAPRARHLGSPDPGDGREARAGLFLESGFGAATRASLAARGHVLLDGHHDVGGYQAVLRDAARGIYRGASESRKDGIALGY
ncbi:gamma-glutamyltransferase family protein [Thermaurantiacus tibetensis]|uniref:gamma-glutamyltransferase family protein n=1 Tax=Thermaurantiacus tibetensis TaxID=2759035 RepID=UPI002E27B9ED|nr:gamma-glutamyltransferase family protein [Thermaurantiacus tibetensis]